MITVRIGESRQGVSFDDLGECRWRKTVGKACGLRRVAVVLVKDQGRGDGVLVIVRCQLQLDAEWTK